MKKIHYYGIKANTILICRKKTSKKSHNLSSVRDVFAPSAIITQLKTRERSYYANSTSRIITGWQYRGLTSSSSSMSESHGSIVRASSIRDPRHKLTRKLRDGRSRCDFFRFCKPDEIHHERFLPRYRFKRSLVFYLKWLISFLYEYIVEKKLIVKWNNICLKRVNMYISDKWKDEQINKWINI